MRSILPRVCNLPWKLIIDTFVVVLAVAVMLYMLSPNKPKDHKTSCLDIYDQSVVACRCAKQHDDDDCFGKCLAGHLLWVGHCSKHWHLRQAESPLAQTEF